jgi:hypothetical protein
MAVVEGRKYLVFLSEGFDADLLRGVTSLDRQDEMRENVLHGESWRVDTEERYGLTETANAVERMIEEFRRADCTIQAVDIGGLRAGADQGPPRVGGRDSLLMMTRGTGGDLYESFNDLGVAMSQMLRRTSVTYVLAVEPEKGSDGGFRRLRVVLKAPLRGVRVVHRPGYYPPKPYAEEDPIEKLLAAANQVMSGEESDGIGTTVLAAPFRSAGEKAYVPVLIAIDGPSLLAGPQPAALPVEIYAYALDEGGAVHDFFTQTVGLDLAKAESPLRQSGLQFFGHLDLLPGDYSLRVLVRNGANGVSGLKVLPLRVPVFEQGEPLLLPPLLPAPGNALLVPEEPRGEGAPAANPFRLRDQPFVPAVHPVLAPGREVRVVLAGYNLGAGPWKGVATVVAAGGREIPGGNLAITGHLDGGAGGPDRAVATFRLPAGLEPGDYELRITLAGAAPRTSSLRFSVPRPGAGRRRGSDPLAARLPAPRSGFTSSRGARRPSARATRGSSRAPSIASTARPAPRSHGSSTPAANLSASASTAPARRSACACWVPASRRPAAASSPTASPRRSPCARRWCRRRPPATGFSTPRGTASRGGRWTASATCW